MPLPCAFPEWRDRIDAYEARIEQCWKKYERRNRELAHLASNLLILLALLYDCRLICGENLTTLKTMGAVGECADGFAIGATTLRSEASYGACSGTSVICWASAAVTWKLVAPLIPARTVTSLPKPISPLLPSSAKKPTTGDPGSVVPIPTCCGTGHAITRRPSILPGWVWLS